MNLLSMFLTLFKYNSSYSKSRENEKALDHKPVYCKLFSLLLFFYFSALFAQPAQSDTSVKHINFYGRSPKVPAYRLNHPVKIDGILSEPVWKKPGVTGFTQENPNEGEPATEKTVVWVAYDDEAVYVGARMYDSKPEAIVARLGRRDQDLASDFFAVGFDSYHDKQTGFYFLVTPAGAIGDGSISNDSNFDDTWDGIWEHGVKIDSLGWTVEMRIPYSQLRFTRKDEYVWGFNVLRFIQRKQESSFLGPIPKDGNKNVSLYPDLVGIKNITPPRRLELLPYVVGSGNFLAVDTDDPFNRNAFFRGNMGTDLKVGLGPNFTLDGTINPDFGQVEVDPAVVNLSAFETFFEEKRPFFIEGAGIFSFGRRGVTNNWGFNNATPSFFYSRRIGRAPQLEPVHDGEADIPLNSTIISAAKISGKTKHNWEVGILSSITAREYAKIDSEGVRFNEELEPLTSYNVVRTFKNFGYNRYGLGFLGTGVFRNLRTENQKALLARNALAGGVDGFMFLGSQRSWAISGWMGASQVSGSKEAITELQQASQHYYQRPDFQYVQLDTTRTTLDGWAGRLALNKERGSTYLNAAIGVNSPGFETNDLGFHWRSNIINNHLVLGYKWFQPGKTFRSANIFLAAFQNYDFDGNNTARGLMSFLFGQFLNYWSVSFRAGYNPETLDITRTRGGPIMINPEAYWGGFSIESDNRKPLVFELEGNYSASTPGGWDYSINPGMQWKPSSRMEVRLSPSYFRNHAIAQWVTDHEDPIADYTYGVRYIFGILDQKEYSSPIRFNYTFTPALSFELFAQPLFSSGHYTDFKELARLRTFDFNHYQQTGSVIYDPNENEYEIDPDGKGQSNFTISNPDFNFKSLRGTAVLRWEFAPGSILFLVWTHERSDFEERGDFNISRDSHALLSAPTNNIIVLKLSYWWNP